MEKFVKLNYAMGKANETEFTPEELDRFNDALIMLVESFGFEIAGGMTPIKDNDEG